MKYTVHYGRYSTSFIQGLPYHHSFNTKKEAIKYANECAKEYSDEYGCYQGGYAAVVILNENKEIVYKNERAK